jgi:hypothetical protein
MLEVAGVVSRRTGVIAGRRAQSRPGVITRHLIDVIGRDPERSADLSSSAPARPKGDDE